MPRMTGRAALTHPLIAGHAFMQTEPGHRHLSFADHIEENLIALLLGAMTVLTFINVIMRYIFKASLIWSLETVLILFAALVLLGMSYAVRKTAHLGVDALTNILPSGPRRALAVVVGLVCIFYAMLLLKGAWDYWAPYAGLSQTGGRWLPTGFIETRDRAFYETEQVPMFWIFRWLEDAINMGETYDKLPRVVPYLTLPVGAALLLFRFVQATIQIIAGKRGSLIVSHEAEEAIEELSHELSATPKLDKH